MLQDRIEAKWIDTFAGQFELCAVRPGETVGIISETQSRPLNVQLAELALLRLGARVFHIVMPTPPQTVGVPIRSSGSSPAIGGLEPVVQALAACDMVVDCTVEGLIHSPEMPVIRQGGARMLYISNDHPESLERTRGEADMKRRILMGRQIMADGQHLHITSDTGTDLHVDMDDCWIGGNMGFVDEPGAWASWPGGISSCFPKPHAVNGTLVLDAGDINYTFKRYLESPITLTIEDDYVVDIQGMGWDAELMRSYFEAWNDPEAYGTSHISWGMNRGARWDSLVMYDKGDVNATEGRAVAGTFLFSTGANPRAGRFTLGHYDLTIRGCTLVMDGRTLIDHGRLTDALA
jgi:2,5-dihydroxypyridine 5,6-dioxygenase